MSTTTTLDQGHVFVASKGLSKLITRFFLIPAGMFLIFFVLNRDPRVIGIFLIIVSAAVIFMIWTRQKLAKADIRKIFIHGDILTIEQMKNSYDIDLNRVTEIEEGFFRKSYFQSYYFIFSLGEDDEHVYCWLSNFKYEDKESMKKIFSDRKIPILISHD